MGPSWTQSITQERHDCLRGAPGCRSSSRMEERAIRTPYFLFSVKPRPAWPGTPSARCVQSATRVQLFVQESPRLAPTSTRSWLIRVVAAPHPRHRELDRSSPGSHQHSQGRIFRHLPHRSGGWFYRPGPWVRQVRRAVKHPLHAVAGTPRELPAHPGRVTRPVQRRDGVFEFERRRPSQPTGRATSWPLEAVGGIPELKHLERRHTSGRDSVRRGS